MHYTLSWLDEAESNLRIAVRGGVGLFDYMPPFNDAAGMAIMVKHPITVEIDIGWSVPFPARGFKALRMHILGGIPSNIHTIKVIVRNPLSRGVMWWGLLRPYPDMRARIQVQATP